jgi:hypothetical protein
VVGPNSLANDDPDLHCRLPRRHQPNVVDRTIDMKTVDRDPPATILASSTRIKVEILHHMPHLLPGDNSHPLYNQRGTKIEETITIADEGVGVYRNATDDIIWGLIIGMTVTIHVQGIIKEPCFGFFWSETDCLETWPMDLYK